MKKVEHRTLLLVVGLLVSAVVWADQPGAAAPQTAPPQEPVGFITGAIIGAFSAGPVGAVVGAGIGTWLGNRVHRAGEATQAETQVATLETDKAVLQSEKEVLQGEKSVLLSQRGPVDTAAAHETAARETVARDDAALALDGLQGDVLFRTGSADVSADTARGLLVLADTVAKSPLLKVRIDGYADARGGEASNQALSLQRADAVRDLLVAAGVSNDALEINAYGKSRSVAQDADGYALERHVRLTLQAKPVAAVARTAAAAQSE